MGLTTIRRPLAVAAVCVALLAGWPATAGDQVDVTAEITAADHELEEGYFGVGQDAAIVAKPGSPLHTWLKTHVGQRVKIVIEPAREQPTED
jgi:hypothetical protein